MKLSETSFFSKNMPKANNGKNYETLLLVILGQILALKPPKTVGWFQINCQKRYGFNETAGWFQKNCQKLKWFH